MQEGLRGGPDGTPRGTPVILTPQHHPRCLGRNSETKDSFLGWGRPQPGTPTEGNDGTDAQGKELVPAGGGNKATPIRQSSEGLLCATDRDAPPTPTPQCTSDTGGKQKVGGTAFSLQLGGFRVEKKTSLDFWIRDKEWSRPGASPSLETPVVRLPESAQRQGTGKWPWVTVL